MESEQLEWVEEQVPLQGIEKAASSLIDMYGGEISSSAAESIAFYLPRRRGVAASGTVDCVLTWSDAGSGGEGTVKIVASRNAGEKMQKVALLFAGVVGATFWLLWPFFPNLGALSWLGAVIAFAAYFLTLKKTDGGLAFDMLQRLASAQREGTETDQDAAVGSAGIVPAVPPASSRPH